MLVGKKSAHGRPSKESERYQRVCPQGNAVSMSALESAEWIVSRLSLFYFGQGKSRIIFSASDTGILGKRNSDQQGSNLQPCLYL